MPNIINYRCNEVIMKKVSLPIDHRLVPHEPGKLPPPPEPPFFPPPISYPPPPPPPCYPPMVTKVQNAIKVVAGDNITVTQGFDGGMTAFEVSTEAVAEMKGATETEDGTAGIAPAPTASGTTKELRYLKADGTWSEVDIDSDELTNYDEL